MKILALSGGKDSMACLHLMQDDLACAIYVDTGYAYPETHKMIDYARTLIEVHTIRSDRYGHNERNGIPADVVPVEWTVTGQAMTGPKSVTIQSALQCCFDNLSRPLLDAAKALGATSVVYGQRHQEQYKAPAQNGTVVEGITRLHPIEDWTTEQVLAYLDTKMEVPTYFRSLQRTSLDCYDCPAYGRVSKDLWAWTARHHPTLYCEFAKRQQIVDTALEEALRCSI